MKTGIKIIAFVFNLLGLCVAFTAVWAEHRDTGRSTLFTRAVDRAQIEVRRVLRMRPVTQTVTLNSAVSVEGAAQLTLTASGFVGTGDPVLDRIMQLEETVKQKVAELQRDHRDLQEEVVRHNERTKDDVQTLRADAAAARRREEEAKAKTSGWELCGLVLVACGTLLQAAADLLPD